MSCFALLALLVNLLKLCPGLYHSRYPATRSTRAPAPGLSDEAKSNKTGEAHVLKNSIEQKKAYSPYLSIYNVCRDTSVQYISSVYIHISYIAVYVCMHIYIYTQLWNHVVYIVISDLSQTSTAFFSHVARWYVHHGRSSTRELPPELSSMWRMKKKIKKNRKLTMKIYPKYQSIQWWVYQHMGVAQK